MSIKVKEELIDFSKIYGKGKKQVKACSNINLCFESGSVTGLLGPNGAGKTTILKALCGFHYPTEGKVCLTSEEYSTEEFNEIRALTGFVPETPTLDTNLTVKEILYNSAKIHSVKESEITKNVDNAIELCSLEDVLYKKAGTLSKGYMQRTSFAKAISYNPKVLILDEYSSGLDPAQIVKMRNTISKLAKEKAVILSTHHIDEALILCKDVYIIAHGNIVSSGTSDEITKKSNARNLEEAFILLTSTEKKAEV